MLTKHVDTWIMEDLFVVLSTSPLIFPSNLIFQLINTQFLNFSQCSFVFQNTAVAPVAHQFQLHSEANFFFPLPFLPPLGIFFFLCFLFWTPFLIGQKSSLNQTSPCAPKLVCNFISSKANMSADPQNERVTFFINFQNHP